MNTRIAQACLLTAAALSTTAYARPHGINHPYQDTSNPHQHTQNERPSHQATQPQTTNAPRTPNTHTQTRAPAQHNPQQRTTTYTTYTTYTYDNHPTNARGNYPRTYHRNHHNDTYQRPIVTTHYQPIRIAHPQIQQRLPIAYRGHHGQAYEIHNWHQHHQLYAPPQGARWMVSVDGDFILASILTGVIYSILR